MSDKQEVDTTKASPVPSNVRMGELGTTGLRVSDGRIYEEVDEHFRWPKLVHTCKMMSRDETVYAATNAIKALIRRIKWRVHTPDLDIETTASVDREKFIWSCMHDMEHSWGDFVNESLSMLTYGFSVHEKVYKRRQGNNDRIKYKSKYEDGKIGWAKLPIRSQDTIYRWLFDSEYNLTGIEQNLSNILDYSLPKAGSKFKYDNSYVTIPANKLLHFKHDSERGNPEGNTPLKACHVAWRYKTTIAEFEAIGVSRDMNGMPVIRIPPEYMSPEASPDKIAVYEYMQDIIRNIHMNEQAGLVFPRFIDPESKQDLFDFELISVDGSKQFDTGKIIDRYENKILMTYLADVLKMGQDSSVGSFALSDNKTNLMAVGIEAILTEFLEVINNDLIPQTAKMNGWDLSQPLPQIMYEDLDERDLDKLGTFVQRTVAAGAMEVDQSLSDELRRAAKLPVADESKKIRKELLPTSQQEGKGGTEAGKKMNSAADTSSGNRVSGSKQTGVST